MALLPMLIDVVDNAELNAEAGTVRLVHGSGRHEGRVEIVFAGTWGTVCDWSWDLLDAIVVCRQLGYYTALSAPVGAFGEGTGPIWLYEVWCSGNEANLTQCRSSHVTQQYCTHSRDAGVVCSGVYACVSHFSVVINKCTIQIVIGNECVKRLYFCTPAVFRNNCKDGYNTYTGVYIFIAPVDMFWPSYMHTPCVCAIFRPH